MAGRVQLETVGIQDRWLTKDPEYSHFISRFKRHTKFSFEQIEIPFDGFDKSYYSENKEFTARIMNNTGDILNGVTLNLDIVSTVIVHPNTKNYTVGFNYDTELLTLDGNDIPHQHRLPIHDNETLIFRSPFELDDLSYPPQFTVTSVYDGSGWVTTVHFDSGGVDVGDVFILIRYFGELEGASYRTFYVYYSRTTYIPSWPSKMIEYVDLLIGGQIVQRITGDYIYMYNQINHTDNELSGLGTTSLHNLGKRLESYTDNEYFSNYFLILPFYFKNHPSLGIPMCGLKAQIIEIKLKLKKSSDICVDSDGLRVYNVTVNPPRNISIFCNFAYVTEEEINFIRSMPIEYVITQTQVSRVQMDPGISNRKFMINFKHPVKELFFLAIDDELLKHVPVKHVSLKFNNNTVIDADDFILSYEQPLLHYKNSINGTYPFGVYSFSLKPYVHYPTGQVNMSRIIHKLMDVDIEPSDVSHSHTLSVYATNYNVLRVSGGIAGLKF